jgi:hypothetical protein
MLQPHRSHPQALQGLRHIPALRHHTQPPSMQPPPIEPRLQLRDSSSPRTLKLKTAAPCRLKIKKQNDGGHNRHTVPPTRFPLYALWGSTHFPLSCRGAPMHTCRLGMCTQQKQNLVLDPGFVRRVTPPRYSTSSFLILVHARDT